jgi:hypothetical protein
LRTAPTKKRQAHIINAGVLEIIVSCMFYQSCSRSEADELRELEPKEMGDLQA